MLNLSLRPFALEDAPAVNALCRSVWWPERSLAGWKWLAEGPPGARADGDSGPPGWVCERDGQVLGFLGNFVQRFQRGDRDYRGATGHTFVVDPSARGAGRLLLRALAEQQGRFAVYLFNANALSASHYRHYGLDPWPVPYDRVKYVWRMDLPAVISERLKWRLAGLRQFEGVREGGERFLDPRLVTGRMGPLAQGVQVVAREAVDGRFDALWRRLIASGRFLAARDAASLAWRMDDPDLTRAPVLLGYEAQGRLSGYLLAYFAKQTEIERTSLDIVDLVAESGHEADAIPALVNSLTRNARRLGAVRVRLQTVTPRLDGLLRGLPGARRVMTHGHCHARFAEGLDGGIAAAWEATPYDGDYSFCLRPPPLDALKVA